MARALGADPDSVVVTTFEAPECDWPTTTSEWHAFGFGPGGGHQMLVTFDRDAGGNVLSAGAFCSRPAHPLADVLGKPRPSPVHLPSLGTGGSSTPGDVALRLARMSALDAVLEERFEFPQRLAPPPGYVPVTHRVLDVDDQQVATIAFSTGVQSHTVRVDQSGQVLASDEVCEDLATALRAAHPEPGALPGDGRASLQARLARVRQAAEPQYPAPGGLPHIPRA